MDCTGMPTPNDHQRLDIPAKRPQLGNDSAFVGAQETSSASHENRSAEDDDRHDNEIF